jgi:hypothetical protein
MSSTASLVSDGAVAKHTELSRQDNFRSLQMNAYGKVTAAIGSIALNVLLTLILSQGAEAATPPAEKLAPNPAVHTHELAAYRHDSDARCVSRLRARTIVAVILGIIV